MQISDDLNIIISIICAIGIYGWLMRLRRWPLRFLAVLALLSNVIFVLVKMLGAPATSDLNLLSLTRILLMALTIAIIPWSVPKP